MTLYFNGKVVKELPENAKHIQTVHNVYFGDEAYIKQQNANSITFFAKQKDLRDDLNERHG